MGISIKQNGNGTITVTCGTEKLTFVPDDEGTTASGGGSAGIPIIEPPPDDSPIGLAPPATAGIVAAKTPTGERVPPVLVEFDHNTNTFRLGSDFEKRIAEYLQDSTTLPDAPVPIGIETAIGESVDLSRINTHLAGLKSKVGHEIVPFLSAPRRGGIKF